MNRLFVFWIGMVLVAGSASVVGAESESASCDEMSELRRANQFSEAVETARACLEARPEDVEAMLELARSLNALDEPEEARDWTEQALEAAPNHADAIVLQARLLARDGDFEAAHTKLEALGPEIRESAEVRRFEADLALWRGAYDEAIEGYTRYLEHDDVDGSAWRNLGHAQIQLGRTEAADRSYRRACELGEQVACRARDGLEARRVPRYFSGIELGHSVVDDRPDGHRLRAKLGVSPTDSTTVEAGYHVVSRGLVGGTRRVDQGPTLAGRWNSGDGLRAGTGAGWTVGADFSPRWNAYLEGGWTFDAGLDAGVRLWRLQFADGGTTVATPSLTYYFGSWMLDGRYYLGVSDDWSVDHSVLGRVGHFFDDHTSVYLGAGLGNRPDYIELSPVHDVPTVGHHTGLVGGAWQPTADHRVNLDLQFRREGDFGAEGAAPTQRYRAFELTFGYTVYSR